MFPRLSTVFWKIFLSYWLVTLIIVVFTGVGFALYVDRDYTQLQRRISDKFHASTAVTLYEAGGPEALRSWLSDRRTPRAATTYFIDESGQDLLGKPIPKNLRPEAIRAGQTDSPPGNRWVVEIIQSESGRTYVFASPTFGGPPDGIVARSWDQWLPPPLRGVSFLLAVLVTGLISFIVARNLTNPIRSLQQAAQRISGGDLAVKVDPRVSRRSDELGDLGRDFDRMSAQIGQLLATQKRMLRDISHELRSPLARLQIALELARKASDDKGEAEHNRIEKEAIRLDELIGQVMSLVRMEDQSGDVEKEPQDIQALLQDVVENASFEASNGGKSVTLKAPGSLVLSINFELIYSAIENIVRNALRYTAPDSEVEIKMEVLVQEVRIRVRDHGPGVSNEALDHLFEPFYRETPARERASGGYGLGLAISAHAIRLHHGSIAARNAEDGGLEVEVTLPIKAT